MTSDSDLASADEVRGLRVWVTGASRGLGRVIAADLSGRGARVAVTARSAIELYSLRDEQPRGSVLCVAGSVTDQDEVDRAADRVREEWGGLDAVVCCAGSSPNFQSAENLDPKVWREIIELNLTGTFLVAQAAARLMTGGGAVVTVSSVHATSGARRLAAYSASKGGVEALTRALALDWAGRGIRVNCIAPGYFDTDMTADLRGNDHHRERLLARIPLRTFGDPTQLLGTTRLLIAAGTYITGSTITVDGGWAIA